MSKKRVSGAWVSDNPHIYNTSSDTLTSFPATVIPDGTNASADIIGNINQSGTPTPSNPITPSECGELEENVAIIDNRSDTITDHYYKDIRISDELPAGTYTISFTMNSKTGSIYASSLGQGNTTTYQTDVSNYYIYDTPVNISRTITLNSNACIWARFLRSSTPATFSYDVSEIAIVSGDKPYGQYKISILSGNTTTNVYLGETQSTRRIKKLVLTGDEASWYNAGGNAPYRIPLSDIISITDIYAVFFLSTHYPAVSYSARWSDYDACITWHYGIKCLQFRDTNQATLTDFKVFLQQQYANGTPVTIWYVLADETTGVINEPIRKIRDYSDTVSVSNIPTTAGSQQFDVDTTLKPSEVSLTYHGWHDKLDKEYNGGTWN